MGVVPAITLAADGVKLSLLPVGQTGAYFDLTMAPGERRSLSVDIGNDGAAALAVRTYSADVYTIVNGGFGARLRDEPTTGTTRWLGYPTAVVTLAAGEHMRRSFTVTVPADAGPGESISSLVLENDRAVPASTSIGLVQVVRQAIAVVVTVPGKRSPAVSTGGASETLVGERSVVKIAVANDGNVRLKPVVGFRLADASGTEIDESTIQMDSFYAHTATTVEFTMATRLTPGVYSVLLTLADSNENIAVDHTLTLVVAPWADVSSDAGGIPALIDSIDRGGPAAPVIATLAILLSVVLGWFVLLRRRYRRAIATALAVPPSEAGGAP